MSSPRVGTLTGSITWSDGTNFNGFGVVGLVLPTSGGTNWPELSLEPGSPRQRLPLWSTIPIVDGAFNNQVGLWYNADIDPPNTTYVIYYYDTSLKQVGVPSGIADAFTISAAQTTPPVYTLTAPVAGTVVPTPDA